MGAVIKMSERCDSDIGLQSAVHRCGWPQSSHLTSKLTSVQGFADDKAPSHEISDFHKNSKERGQAPLPLLPFLQGAQLFILWIQLQGPLAWSTFPALPGLG